MTDIVDIQHLDAARFKFTELGDAISEVSQRNTEMIDALGASLRDSFKTVFSDLENDPTLKEGSKLTGMGQEYVQGVSQKFEKLAGSMGKSFDELEKTVKAAEKDFESLSAGARGLVDKADAVAGQVDAEDGGGGAKGRDSKGRKKSGARAWAANKSKQVVRSEWRTLKGKIGGMMQKLKVPKWKALAAGGIGIMIHGYMDRDRVRAQAGEMKNILIAAYDDGVKGAVRSGTRHLSSIQESLQQYMGINREQIQSVAQAFVDGGVSVDQMTRTVDTRLKGVHSSAVTVTLALDKMFELGGGESAKRMVGLMADYGKTTDEARESLTRMYMVGRDSGIGAMQYVKNVEDAGKELAKMGYDIDNVVDIYSHVTEQFSKMGVPKQFAGKQAAMGIQQMASGIAKMSDSWKIILGERLGYGRGLEARQKMMDAFRRVAEGNNSGEVTRIVEAVYDIAMEATGGDEETARFYMEKQMGLGFEGARLIAEIGSKMKEGKTVEAATAAKQNSEILSKSFGVEATKRSKFERTMNSWMKGLAKVGQGIMGMVIQAVSWLIAFFKALPEFIVNGISGDQQDNNRLAADINALFGNTEEHKRKMNRGLSQMTKAMKRMGSDVLGTSMKTLQEAWNFDPASSRLRSMPGTKGRGAGNAFAPSQVVQIPVASLQSGQSSMAPKQMAKAPASVKKDPQAAQSEWDGPWAGGGVTLEVGGVDTQGNISFEIGGNCPRCGLSFASEEAELEGEFSSMALASEGKYTGDDVEALARVLQSEAGGYSPARKKELVGIAHTLINRAKGRGGGALKNKATSGKGWGKQNNNKRYNRQYATRRRPSQATIDFARSILRGDSGTQDWTKGATGFIHANEGEGLPPFMRGGGLLGSIPSGGRNYERALFWRPGADTAAGREAREWATGKQHRERTKKRQGEQANQLAALGLAPG